MPRARGPALRARLSTPTGRDLSEAAVDIGDVKVLAEIIDDTDPASLRAAIDRLKDKLSFPNIRM